MASQPEEVQSAGLGVRAPRRPPTTPAGAPPSPSSPAGAPPSPSSPASEPASEPGAEPGAASRGGRWANLVRGGLGAARSGATSNGSEKRHGAPGTTVRTSSSSLEDDAGDLADITASGIVLLTRALDWLFRRSGKDLVATRKEAKRIARPLTRYVLRRWDIFGDSEVTASDRKDLIRVGLNTGEWVARATMGLPGGADELEPEELGDDDQADDEAARQFAERYDPRGVAGGWTVGGGGVPAQPRGAGVQPAPE
jgi:hypothetical protein